MPNFRRGDVIKLPFPSADRSTRQFRPALVVSAGDIEDTHGLLWKLPAPVDLRRFKRVRLTS